MPDPCQAHDPHLPDAAALISGTLTGSGSRVAGLADAEMSEVGSDAGPHVAIGARRPGLVCLLLLVLLVFGVYLFQQLVYLLLKFVYILMDAVHLLFQVLLAGLHLLLQIVKLLLQVLLAGLLFLLYLFLDLLPLGFAFFLACCFLASTFFFTSCLACLPLASIFFLASCLVWSETIPHPATDTRSTITTSTLATLDLSSSVASCLYLDFVVLYGNHPASSGSGGHHPRHEAVR